MVETDTGYDPYNHNPYAHAHVLSPFMVDMWRKAMDDMAKMADQPGSLLSNTRLITVRRPPRYQPRKETGHES